MVKSRPGVPALLRGLEKLKDGRGRGADRSDAIEGDRWACGKAGEAAWELEIPLPLDNFLGGRE